MKTGGGPSDKPICAETEEILKMIPDQLESLENNFDSDATNGASCMTMTILFEFRSVTNF